MAEVLDKVEITQKSPNGHSVNPKGNKGGYRPGCGRKPKQQMFTDKTLQERRKIFYAMVTDEDFKEIVANYIAGAKKTPAQAEFIINQLIGKASQAIEVSGEGGGPLKLQLDFGQASEIQRSL